MSNDVRNFGTISNENGIDSNLFQFGGFRIKKLRQFWENLNSRNSTGSELHHHNLKDLVGLSDNFCSPEDIPNSSSTSVVSCTEFDALNLNLKNSLDSCYSISRSRFDTVPGRAIHLSTPINFRMSDSGCNNEAFRKDPSHEVHENLPLDKFIQEKLLEDTIEEKLLKVELSQQEISSEIKSLQGNLLSRDILPQEETESKKMGSSFRFEDEASNGENRDPRKNSISNRQEIFLINKGDTQNQYVESGQENSVSNEDKNGEYKDFVLDWQEDAFISEDNSEHKDFILDQRDDDLKKQDNSHAHKKSEIRTHAVKNHVQKKTHRNVKRLDSNKQTKAIKECSSKKATVKKKSKECESLELKDIELWKDTNYSRTENKEAFKTTLEDSYLIKLIKLGNDLKTGDFETANIYKDDSIKDNTKDQKMVEKGRSKANVLSNSIPNIFKVKRFKSLIGSCSTSSIDNYNSNVRNLKLMNCLRGSSRKFSKSNIKKMCLNNPTLKSNENTINNGNSTILNESLSNKISDRHKKEISKTKRMESKGGRSKSMPLRKLNHLFRNNKLLDNNNNNNNNNNKNNNNISGSTSVTATTNTNTTNTTSSTINSANQFFYFDNANDLCDVNNHVERVNGNSQRLAREIEKIRKFFSSNYPRNMSHSWEIDPSEIDFLDKIGDGTTSSVYRGIYRSQNVAIKVLKSFNSKKLHNFSKELDIICNFRSSYVIYFFGAFLNPIPTMILGYCAKGSLFEVMKSSVVFTWMIVIKIALNTLRGLSGMHNWKPQIVHRDLKSRNILIDEDWNPKLCDFGESRYTTTKNFETLCKVRGTYAYIAPEIYFGQTFTKKSDIYAFGLILWELCTRCALRYYAPPFAEYKHLNFDFQIIVQASRNGLRPNIDPSVPSALRNLICLCWDHEPSNRPDTDVMLRFLNDVSSPDIIEKPHKWQRLNSALNYPPSSGIGVPGKPPMLERQ